MSFASRLRRISALVTWHRRLGLTAAVFVLVLAVTGLTLNHTDDLGLDERHLAAGWLLNWYGIEAPHDADSYVLSYGVVTRLGDRLYLDTRLVEQDVGTIAGAVTSEDLVIVAVDGDLLLLTADGERVERLGREDGLPQGVDGLGVDPANRVLLRSGDGLYRADSALLSWDRVGDRPGPDPLGKTGRDRRGDAGHAAGGLSGEHPEPGARAAGSAQWPHSRPLRTLADGFRGRPAAGARSHRHLCCGARARRRQQNGPEGPCSKSGPVTRPLIRPPGSGR